MAFQQFPLSVVGASSKNRSAQANNELTKNWYAQIPEGNALAAAILLPWLGADTFGTSSGNLDRGVHVYQGELYHVVNQTLYKVDAAGVYTSIGAIAGTQRCIFSNSAIETDNWLVIAAGASGVYSYDGTTLATAAFTANSVTYLNSKSIYDGSGFEFGVSTSSGPLVLGPTGSAESSPDDLLRPYAFNQWVYMFGTETIEPFYDNGSATFARIDNAIMQKGLGGLYTVANTDSALYFLGDDSNVYQIIQSQLTQISPPSIVNSIKDLNKDNATGYTINVNGQDFYILWFADDMAYAYQEQIGEWINLSSGVGDTNPYLAKSYARVYDKHIAVDYRTANTVELSLDAYDELGETIQRRRVLPQFTSKNAGLPYGKRLTMSDIVFALQTGVGLVTGQGSDPEIMVEYSLDGGEDWSTERWLPIGRMGKYLLRPKYDEMVSFYEITFRITISDPVFSSLHDATISVKDGGY